MTRAKYLVVICLFILLSQHLNLLVAKVGAQESVRNYTVSPTAVERSFDPGGYAEGAMSIINDSPDPLTFTASVRDYIVEDTNGVPNILPPNELSNKYSAASWIGVAPATFTVPSKTRQTINFYIQVPKDARPGGHYAAIILTPSNGTETPQTGAVVQTQIATLFYIAVNGDIKESATVSSFLTENLQESGPVKIFTRITNLGDLHIKPKGYITVSNMFGRPVYTLPVEGKNIFPGKARDFETSFGGKNMFGRYKADLAVKYGKNGSLPLEATIYFWIIPWRLLLVIALVIVALVLGFLVYKKKKQPKEPKSQPTQEQQAPDPQVPQS
jgi:hypothetical protein